MTPATQGRYCDQCCKVVVDFTACSNEEIVSYLQQNSGRRICGRVKREMLETPKPKFRTVRFLAGLLLAFGAALFSSCGNDSDDHAVGDVAYIPNDSVRKAQQLQFEKDSTRHADSVDAASKPTEVFKLSKEDSAKVADSVERHTDHLRDFK